MSKPKPEIGSVVWTDLTVPDAESVRDFYQKVVGWVSGPVDMGDYVDFNMNAPGSGEAKTGICHARGVNADLPPQWLIYIVVEDIERSVERAVELGGALVSSPREMGGHGRYCVIRDPAGAVAALFQLAK